MAQNSNIRDLYEKLEEQNKKASETFVKMKNDFEHRVRDILEKHEQMKTKMSTMEDERRKGDRNNEYSLVVRGDETGKKLW